MIRHHLNSRPLLIKTKYHHNYFVNNKKSSSCYYKVHNPHHFQVRKISIHSTCASQLLLESGQRIIYNHQHYFFKSIITTQVATEEEESNNARILSCSTTSSYRDKTIIKNVMNKIIKSVQTLWDFLMILLRTTEIGIRLSPLVILTPAAILASKRVGNGNDHDVSYYHDTNTAVLSKIAWKYTLYTIQQLGPVFIKVSQWASTRRDIFPSQVCDRLSGLTDQAFLHSWDHTHKILIKSLGNNYEDTLKIDKNDIIGSGSVAQVYSGIWKDQKQVAVKVLHPNIHEYVERDLLLMKRVANFIDHIPSQTIKMLSLPRACANFTNIINLQVDLRNEGYNLDQFRDNFKCKVEKGTMKVSFPEPIVSTADCLVEDYMGDSRPISDYLLDKSTNGMIVRRKLAGPLLRAFLQMVFMDNFIHCDLHPGNILVRKTKTVPNRSWWDAVVMSDDGKSDVKGEDKYTIIFLDAGIVTTLNRRDQQNLKDLFKAVILNNGEEAGKLMVERAQFERCSCTEGGVEKFSKGIAGIVSEFHDRRKQGLTLGVVRIGSLLGKVLELCRTHQVEIDPAMANVVMSTLVLEGLGRALEPNLNLFDIALPFVLGRGKL